MLSRDLWVFGSELHHEPLKLCFELELTSHWLAVVLVDMKLVISVPNTMEYIDDVIGEVADLPPRTFA